MYGEKDETIDHIKSEWNKVNQKENKSKYDWVGKVIHLELCKWLKFDQTNKWYMYKSESFLENKTDKIIWNFEVKMDYPIHAWRRDSVGVNQKKLTCQFVDFAVPDHGEKEKKKTKKMKKKMKNI